VPKLDYFSIIFSHFAVIANVLVHVSSQRGLLKALDPQTTEQLFIKDVTGVYCINALLHKQYGTVFATSLTARCKGIFEAAAESYTTLH